MNLRPLAASEYVTFTPAYQSLLTQFGCVAVNDKLLPVWKFDYDILLLYGGRGGGKSEAECDALLHESINSEYFKCYYGRKVFDTVRGSCFATLVYCIKKNKLEHLFHYSEADTSSMIITCLANGNKFIPFGSDKADKLKSIKDPTHIWCEEFDQFDFADFKVLYPTLRTIRGANRFIGTFNTHEVLPTHWILKIFFPDLYEGTDKDDVLMTDLLKGANVQKIFVNFPDNHFIDQEDYKKRLMLSSGGNLTIYEGLANGAWGVNINDSPWLFAWNAAKHMSKVELFANPMHPLYLCWDFNRNPMACVIIQWYNETVFIIDVIKEPNVGTEGMCDIVKAKYPASKFLYIITGDYSGDTVSSLFKEQVTNYTVIKKALGLSDGQIKITPNPPLVKNRTLVNAIFFAYKVLVCPVKARYFKFDAENVKQTAEGKIDKADGNRNDPTKQADCFTADTLVLTDHGNIRIDAINIGDKVLTRKGYRKVIDKWDSMAEVWEFELENGDKIKCTKDHKFYTNNSGFLPIFRIFKENITLWKLQSFTMETGTPSTQNRTTFIPVNHSSKQRDFIQDAYTGKNGLMPMGQYLKVLMCTIKMATLSIMNFLITRLNITVNIKASTQKKGSPITRSSMLNSKRKELLLHQNGINHQRVLNGTDRTQSIPGLGIKPTDQKAVNHAQRLLKRKIIIPDFVPMLVNQHGGEKTVLIRKWPNAQPAQANSKHLNTYQKNTVQNPANLHQTHSEVRVKKATLLGVQKVYDITVKGEHEFYANGILVHNCLDAARYFMNYFMGWFLKADKK